MTRVLAFWDTSALVPLFLRQSTTPLVMKLYKVHEVVVWWSTPVEIASAAARLLRIGQISTDDFAKARRLAKEFFLSWSVVAPSDAVRATAIRLVERYDLRAADSLQLAAAFQWCEDAPHGRIFLTGDRRLHDAALLSGFDARKI